MQMFMKKNCFACGVCAMMDSNTGDRYVMPMKKYLTMILALSLLLAGCGKETESAKVSKTENSAVRQIQSTPSPTPIPTPEPTPEPTPKPISPEVLALLDQNKAVWREKHERPWMAGRLLIPAAGIDGALFVWGTVPEGELTQEQIEEIVRQSVTDAEDSAILYSDGIGNIIADHSNQSFSTLTAVAVGDAAYILAGDCIVSLRCDLVTDGINSGQGITDADGVWVTANDDFVCYTCGEDWMHIKIAGFREIDEDFFEMDEYDEKGTRYYSADPNDPVIVEG